MNIMLKTLSKYFGGIPDAHIDAALYSLIAWVIFSQTFLGGDEAAKYIDATLKFWLNYAFGSLGAASGAIKMYRSDGFSKYKETREKTSISAKLDQIP